MISFSSQQHDRRLCLFSCILIKTNAYFQDLVSNKITFSYLDNNTFYLRSVFKISVSYSANLLDKVHFLVFHVFSFFCNNKMW